MTLNLTPHPTRTDIDAEGFRLPYRPATLIRKAIAPPSPALTAQQRQAQVDDFRHSMAGVTEESILDMAKFIVKEQHVPTELLAFQA